MIRVEFDPEGRPELLTEEQREWFAQWKVRAQEATDRVIRAWEAWRLSKRDPASLTTAQREWLSQWMSSPEAKRLTPSKEGKFVYKFEEDVWSQMKNWLLEHIFRFKCAYCEQSLTTQPRHAEHFRPKAQVKAGKTKARIKDDVGQEVTHPGYFWLAYHWQNLVPSCTFCNTVNGKKDKFPVLRDYAPVMQQLTDDAFAALEQKIIRSQQFDKVYYMQPRDLDSVEGRMLLHPCFDDPQKCLSFDEFGMAIEVGSEQERKIAKCSIETYHLNGDGSIKGRRSAQDAAKNFYTTAIIYHRTKDLNAKSERAIREIAKQDTLDRFFRPEEPYSAAILAGLKLHDPDIFQ